ncbi:rhamnulokinase [Actinophytocola algeriensis]|uniref:Rhamnulokinase n=1 Tax=Actinophytocola algeriensis TaxID=1768010 RepID=A0A7W7QEK1_9PSEU|nr:rhamnulokinase family protein [Actinophytocola algeriensis]MBB4912182.1 rhamnulokinase [Actinophytocola algeriensis]MBE1474302.1 rhamnulokinase [Actinophytocola algeriensis]
MRNVRVAAADLGAASGRVIVGEAGADSLALREVHRFPNRPVRAGRTLHWDILALYQGVLDGLRAAGPVDGIGIDSWAVDYGLLDADGALLGNPVHYRDERTAGAKGNLERLGARELYATTGLQFLPFNTIHQLAAEPRLGIAHRLLLIPDLLAYWLTGEQGAEVTNASTTQLLDVKTRRWATGLMANAGVDPALFPELREPGTVIGDADGTPVIAVGSHDTASAVVGVPAEHERFAYISCGTWSLVGVELDTPVLTEASREANFTNELGVDGTVRYLRNVMGLWLLQECVREWGADTGELLREAEKRPRAAVIDPDDPVFLPPGAMAARIADACERADQPVPEDRPAIVRCVVDSLADAHRRAVEDAQALSGKAVDVVHMVGGGARNTLLCQLTADACGLPVVAGPVEATAIGNVLVQARALGALAGDLTRLRALIRATQPVTRYQPVPRPRSARG